MCPIWRYSRSMSNRKSADDMSEYARAFAAEIRAERTAKRMTQAELAKRARLGLSTIGRIEKEERDADTTQLWRICRALGVSVTELSERAERRLEAQRGRSSRPEAAGG